MTDFKKQYRTVGLTVFVISIALLVMRIVSYYIQVALIDSTMEESLLYMLLDICFSVPVQLGILLIFPLLMYKFGLKKSAKELLGFSGYRKCGIREMLIALLIGCLIPFVSMGLSIFWQIILILFGYIPSGENVLPAQFSPIYFLLSVFITAVLPAFCEEFANRGGLLTVMRSTHSKNKTILLIGIAFGLFHQNITQVFYTAVLGALLAYLVLETGSVFPAILVHFMNNFISVYLDNATTYGWALGGGFNEFLNNASFSVVSGGFAIIALAVFGLALLLRKCNKNKEKDYYLSLNEAYVASDEKIDIRDNIFYIGAIVVAASATILTYVLGL